MPLELRPSVMPVFLRGDLFSGTLNFGLCSFGEPVSGNSSDADAQDSASCSLSLLARTAGRRGFLGEADRRAPEISIRCPIDMLRGTRSSRGVHGGVSRGVRSVGVAEPGVAVPDAGAVRGDLASSGTVTVVTEPNGTRRIGIMRSLSTRLARGLSGSRGVLPPEGGVVDCGRLLTGMVVIGGILSFDWQSGQLAQG
jgi:hypothetical protein